MTTELKHTAMMEMPDITKYLDDDIEFRDDLGKWAEKHYRVISKALTTRTPEAGKAGAVVGMAKLLRDMLYAIEKGAINSEIVEHPDPETGFRGHQFHDEWAHYAKKTLTAYQAYKDKME